MFLKKLMLAGFCLAALLKVSHAQNLDSLLTKYAEKTPVEKIYVHFDNTRYQAGQTIWYKAYLMNDMEPSVLSKNFYIDWYNEKGKMIRHDVCPIIYGSTWGSYIIPENYGLGSIHMVAYTEWMRNFDSAYFYRNKLYITPKENAVEKNANANTKKNLPNTAAKPVTSVLPEASIQFLPESGNSVINLTSIMAFKAVNQSGFPMNVSGVIRNKSGAEIAEFRSVHDGMGKFTYLPQEHEKYTAVWKDEIGNSHETDLPEAKPTGITLNVEYGELDRSYHIQRSRDVPEAWKKVTILAQMNGQILYKAVANLSSKESLSGRIPIGQFPSGLMQITLFSLNNEPICERTIFINNEEYKLDATFKVDTLALGRKEKNVFEIEVNDSIKSNLSLAITDAGINGAPEQSIISQMLLSGELKGYIHQPTYYFDSNADSVARHLDLVMMTNGWTRYNWKEILSGRERQFSFHRDSSYLNVVGRIENISEAKIKKAALIDLIMVSKDSSKTMMFLPIEKDGSFGEKNVLLFDSTQVFYKLNGTAMGWRSKVLLGTNFYQPDSTRILPINNTRIDTAGLGYARWIISEQKRLEELQKQTTLKEVVVHTKVKSKLEELNEKYTSGLFTSDNAYSFDMINETAGGETVLGYLQGRVPGLTINNPNSPDATATWRGSGTSFFVDEFHSDAERIFAIPMSDIALIKVFRPPFFGSMGGGGGGAIAVYTKKGSDATRTMRGLDYQYIMGYAPIREFYSPNYAEQQNVFTQKDLRSTLLWNPRIITKKGEHNYKIVFYNNDISKSFRVVLEGMNEEGKMLHFSKLLQ